MNNDRFVKIPKTKEEYYSLALEDREALKNGNTIKFLGKPWLISLGVDDETVNLLCEDLVYHV